MDALWRALEKQGFFGFASLSAAEFISLLDREGVPEATKARYGVHQTRQVIAVALRYGEGEYPEPGWASRREDAADNGIRLEIARFARANWYAECARRLEAAVKSAIFRQAADGGSGLPPARMWKRLVNSGLPEKPAAIASGLGIMGRNGIVIARGNGVTEKPSSGAAYSSAVVLGLLLCPDEIGPCPRPEAPAASSFDPCRSCRRCIDACPSGALSLPHEAVPDAEEGSRSETRRRKTKYDRLKCLQHWTALPGEIPGELAAVWDRRLYGCDSCLEACPWFRTDPAASTAIGPLGPGLPAEFFLRNGDGEIRARLSGSALGMRWMSLEGFRRSARLAR